jgi:hypothetical protein
MHFLNEITEILCTSISDISKKMPRQSALSAACALCYVLNLQQLVIDSP